MTDTINPSIQGDFFRLLTARFLFTMAVQMQAVMLGFRMYTLTHSPLYLGMIGLAEAVPALSLALYAGFVVDRSNPLRVYRLVILASLASGAVFWASQTPQLGVGHGAQIVMLFVSSCATGLARAFSQPAIYAVVPRLVPRPLLPKASAYMSTSMQIARVAGPGLGGLLLGVIGAPMSVGLVCLLLVLGSIILFGLQTLEASAAASKTNLVDELFGGARFVFHHPILLPALSLDMLSVLFGGVTALLPVFASEILHVDAQGLGMLRAAPAIGAAMMGVVLAYVNIARRAGSLLLASVTGFGICMLTFGLSQNFVLSLVVLGISGAFDSISVVIRSTAVQLESPAHMRGRISAVNAIFIGSSNELGEFESGVMADMLGTVPAVLWGGVFCLAIVLIVGVRCTALRRLDLSDQHSS